MAAEKIQMDVPSHLSDTSAVLCSLQDVLAEADRGTKPRAWRQGHGLSPQPFVSSGTSCRLVPGVMGKAGSVQWPWAFLLSARSPWCELGCEMRVNAGNSIITKWGFAALSRHPLCGFGFVPFCQYDGEMTAPLCLGSR